MKDTVKIAEKLFPSFNLNKYAFYGLSDEEREVLGISPSRAGEVEKQVDVEQATPHLSSTNSGMASAPHQTIVF